MSLPVPSEDFVDTLRFGAILAVAELTLYEYSESGSITSQISVPCSAAQITNDRNSAQRRSGSITVELIPSVPPPPLLPTAPPTPGTPQPLAPFGNEIEIALGIAVGNTNATPLATLVNDGPMNSASLTVTDIASDTLAITVGDTIAVGSAAPVVVDGISGSGPYVLALQTPLSSDQPAGTAVQLTQFVSLGLFTITSTTIESTAENLVVTLDVSDRSFVISQRQLTGPYSFPATEGGTYEEEVMALLNQVWGTYPSMPALSYSFSNFNNPIIPSANYNQGSDPWQMALDLAAVAGNELYVDENGTITSHAYPDVTTAPVVWYFTDDTSDIYSDPTKTVASGSPYTVPVAVTVTFTRDGIYNDVYITGSGTQNAPGASTSSSTATGAGGSTSTTSASPVLGHAADTNPNSATYVEGPLGILPEFTSSNLVPTASQAQAMASLDLAMSISSSWQIEVTSQPNPLFDVDDIVSVNYPSVGVVSPGGLGLCMIVDTIVTGITYADVTTVTGRVIPGRYA